jgi:hypothetical protein
MFLPRAMKPAGHQGETTPCLRRFAMLSGAMLRLFRDAASSDGPIDPDVCRRAHPETGTRHATESASLHPVPSLLLKAWLLVSVLTLWVCLAAVFQLAFSLRWYLT